MKKTALTLTELLMVVVILSILVATGVPIYDNTIKNASGRDAKANLLMISAAQKIYDAENGVYFAGNEAQIESALHVNLMSESLTFSCTIPIPDTFRCTATHKDGWTCIITNTGEIIVGAGAPDTCD